MEYFKHPGHLNIREKPDDMVGALRYTVDAEFNQRSARRRRETIYSLMALCLIFGIGMMTGSLITLWGIR